jgi:hypothetical protein
VYEVQSRGHQPQSVDDVFDQMPVGHVVADAQSIRSNVVDEFDALSSRVEQAGGCVLEQDAYARRCGRLDDSREAVHDPASKHVERWWSQRMPPSWMDENAVRAEFGCQASRGQELLHAPTPHRVVDAGEVDVDSRRHLDMVRART